MDKLEMLSRRLEDMRFIPQNTKSVYPCPQSVMRYLNCHGTVKDPNTIVESLTITASNILENGQLPSVEGRSEDIPESPSKSSVRRRQHKRQKQKLKHLIEKCKESATESLANHKNFYPEYMLLDDVKIGLDNGELFEGNIRISQKCNNEAYVPSPDKSKDILIIDTRARNRALNGDKVVVKILDKRQWRNPDTEEYQRTGEVVYIKESKENRIVVGYLIVERGLNHRYSSLIPRDQRFPKVFVDTSIWPMPIDLKDGTKESTELFYAILLRWENFKFPMGVLKGVLGESGEINAETQGILYTHEIEEEPYPKDIDKYFPPPFSVNEELMHRKDFRQHCIFSIDPPTAKDLDDALSCVLLPNGNYEIGIHISDVSHFVKQGTPLDEIAEKLATSVYLVHRVYHMLPPTLTMMASLLPGADKLAVSIILEMSPDANVISHKFCQSIIHSCAQLHYSHAQIFLENPDKNDWDESEFPTIHNGFTLNDCATAVSYLHKLATIMRKRRFNNGALSINQPKLSFEIDRTTCEPLSYSLYILHESNWLIEEYMLLANTLVAEHLKTHFPNTAMLRNHRPPDSSPMEKVAKMLNTYNIKIDYTSAGSIQKSKALYCDTEVSECRNIVINNILSKPMVRAEYCVCDPKKNMSHFALNVPYYTHFTSPIRRYPDIVVHRFLISWLTNTTIEDYKDPNVIKNIAINSNDKKNNAKKASECSTEIYIACLIGKLGGVKEYGSVLEIKENYFEAIVLSMNISVRVYVNNKLHNPDMEHESSHYSVIDNKPTMMIVWNAKNDIKQTLQLFDKVKLKLTKKTTYLRLRAVLIQED